MDGWYKNVECSERERDVLYRSLIYLVLKELHRNHRKEVEKVKALKHYSIEVNCLYLILWFCIGNVVMYVARSLCLIML